MGGDHLQALLVSEGLRLLVQRVHEPASFASSSSTSSRTSSPRAASPRTSAATVAHRGEMCRSGSSRYFSSCADSQSGGLAKKPATVLVTVVDLVGFSLIGRGRESANRTS